MRGKFNLVCGFAILVFCISACRGQSLPTPAVTAPAISVQITDEYCPSLEVQPGMQIMWTNMDSIDHTLIIERTNEQAVVVDSGGTDLLRPGDSFSITLSDAGQYTYYCSKDRTSSGTISVFPVSYPSYPYP